MFEPIIILKNFNVHKYTQIYQNFILFGNCLLKIDHKIITIFNTRIVFSLHSGK